MTQTIALISLAVFAATMVVIGIVSSRHTKSMDGFLLGGRKIGPWMSAFAYGTTYFSAVIFVGYAGTHGWNIGIASIWIGAGNALIGCLLSWKLLASRTRNMTHRLGARTMPEFFSERYLSRNMKLFAACIIFIFLLPYAASVYKGLGMLFSAVFFPGLDPVKDAAFLGLSATNLCIFIVAILTSVYLVLGGYVAIALSDFVQGIIMIAGVVIMVIALTMHENVGGLGNAFANLKAMDPGLVDLTGGSKWSFLAFNILLTSIGVFGLPQMAQKFYAIKDQASIKRATIVSTLFALIIGCGAYYVGSLSHLMITQEEFAAFGSNTDAIIPNLLMKAFSDSLPGNILLAVIVLLVLSASMSTLSSVVLTSSTAVTVDLFKVLRPGIKEKSQMIMTRGLCLVFIALSVVFATQNFAIIVSIMSYSWGLVAGCFIGPFIWGLFWKGVTRAGAWCGMLAGVSTVLIMALISMFSQPILQTDGLYAAFKEASKNSPVFGVCAMGASLAVVPLVSLFTKKYTKDHLTNVFSKSGEENAA